MKKLVLLFFATAMMAATVFTTSCNKDDDNTPDYGDPFGEGNPYSTRPEFIDEIHVGTEFDVKWTPATYIDNTQFEYELFWYNARESDKISLDVSSERHSLGRQKDTVYHFSLDSGLFEDECAYDLILVTHYKYKNRECQIETDAISIVFSSSFIIPELLP